jgi:hypothetical protein
MHRSHILEQMNAEPSVSRKGGFVRAEMRVQQAFQILSFSWFHYLFDEFDWKGKRYSRMDEMEGLTRAAIIYVPLRELLRKFDGYCNGHCSAYGSLELPPATHSRGITAPLLRAQLVFLCSPILDADCSRLPLPSDWLNMSAVLYQLKPLQARAGCVPPLHDAARHTRRPHRFASHDNVTAMHVGATLLEGGTTVFQASKSAYFATNCSAVRSPGAARTTLHDATPSCQVSCLSDAPLYR